MASEVPNPSPTTAPLAVTVTPSVQVPLGAWRKKSTAPVVDGGMGNPATMPVRVTASSLPWNAMATPKPMAGLPGGGVSRRIDSRDSIQVLVNSGVGQS
jgi:hypothetical protein